VNTAESHKTSYHWWLSTLSTLFLGNTTAPMTSPIFAWRAIGLTFPKGQILRVGKAKLIPLFDPRSQNSSEHFETRGELIIGRTPIGRVTVCVLKMNDDDRRELRRTLD
jgi:hypothetical protein